MNLQYLGHRLRKARKYRGITQQAAADALRLPRTAMTQIELGHRSVSTFELTQLAKLYGYSISYFVNDEHFQEEDEDIEVLLYRVAPSLFDKVKTKQRLNHYIALCREGMALERLMGQDIFLNSQEKIGKSYLKALQMLSDLDKPEEQVLWDREFKNQLAQLAIKAYRREEISRGRVFELGELLGMGGENLFDLARAALADARGQ